MSEPVPPPPSVPAGDGAGGAELEHLLRTAGPEALLVLVSAYGARLSPQEARQALRNPYCTTEVVEEIAGQERLLSYSEVRRDLALHPRTPEVLAMRFIPGLWWRDLALLGLDTRLRPTLRRAADLRLAARLPELAVGERVSLARRASPGVLPHLRHDPQPQVIAALLDNPRLTEGILAPLLHSPSTPAAILDLIAADRRWGARYPLRAALARNPRTPVETVLKILSTLRKPDQKAVAADPRLPEPVRRRARLLLGESI